MVVSMLEGLATFLMIGVAIYVSHLATLDSYLKGSSFFKYNLIPELQSRPFPDIVICPHNLNNPPYSRQIYFKNLESQINQINYSKQQEVYSQLYDNPDDLLFTLDDINLSCVTFLTNKYKRCNIQRKSNVTAKNETVMSTETYKGTKEVTAEVLEIITWRGRCFKLKVNESSNNNPTDGLFVTLNGKLKYTITIYFMNKSYPFLSPEKEIVLEPGQQIRISSAREYVKLVDVKGQWMYAKRQCYADDTYVPWQQRIATYFFKDLNISCIPNNVMSIFTGYPWIKTKDAAMRNCTWTEETEIWTRIGYDDNLQKFCKNESACYPKCRNIREVYLTEYTKDVKDVSKIILNGRPSNVVSIEEELEVKLHDIIITIGSNLGLFVGLSILDFIKFIIGRLSCLNQL